MELVTTVAFGKRPQTSFNLVSPADSLDYQPHNQLGPDNKDNQPARIFVKWEVLFCWIFL